MKLKLVLEYDGTPFCGWQQQDGMFTVQGELERSLGVYLDSLARKCHLDPVPTPGIMGSGRTDSGVHALGQVASFLWPDTLPLRLGEIRAALNGITPRELSIRSVEIMPNSFDARVTLHRKQYSYLIGLHRGSDGFYGKRLWHITARLDVAAMAAAARHFVGKHDFSSFRAGDCLAKSTGRTVFVSELSRIGSEQLQFVVQGNGFLKQMIRIMTGTLVDVGRGRLRAEQIPELIAARNRELAGPTAPAHGLTLDWVRYPEQEIGNAEVDEADE
ncbi:MAG: tRNA pseudouridine(38-40) synthase TruA [Bdellovibrionota bacterium]